MNKYDAQAFSKRLYNLINSKTTPKKLAKATGISVNTLRLWYRGVHLPTATTLMLALNELQPTQEELLWLFKTDDD